MARAEVQQGASSEVQPPSLGTGRNTGRTTYDYTGEPAAAVEVVGSGEFFRKCTAVRTTALLKACQSLISDERLNVFRFAHLSWKSIWKPQQLEVGSHTEIAKSASPGSTSDRRRTEPPQNASSARIRCRCGSTCSARAGSGNRRPRGRTIGETGKGKIQFKSRDLLADEGCTQPILDFPRTTKGGAG